MTVPALNSHPTGLTAVAIILVNWHNAADCIECLDSLLGLRCDDFSIFIVDNASQDGSVEKIAAWCRSPEPAEGWRRHVGVQRWTDAHRGIAVSCEIADASLNQPLLRHPKVTLVRSGSNLGFAGGCNVGMRFASIERHDYFWFLNTDTVVHQDALGALLAKARQDARFGMVGSTLLYYDRPQIVQALGGARMQPARAASRHIGELLPLTAVPYSEAEVEARMHYVFGASMLVSTALVREIGPMQEDYFLYFEEADWAMRSTPRFRMGYASGSHVFHKSGASSSQHLPHFTANLFYRNRLRFMRRFFPEHYAAAKRSLLIELLRFACKLDWPHVRLLAGILRDAEQIGRQAVISCEYARP